MNTPAPVAYLDLPDHARSTRLRALADALGATMTGPGAGGEGASGTEGASGADDGSEGASGGQGGGDGASGAGDPPKYADIIGELTEAQRAAVVAEVTKKNTEARQQRDRAKAAEKKARLYDESQAAEQTAEQKAQEAARKADERVASMRARVATAEVRGLAAAKFADPEDAVAFLDTSSYIDDEGTVDTESITSDLDALLARKPHLGKASGTQNGSGPRRPAPDGSQGSSASGNGGRATGVAAGADLYRSRHQRPAAGVQTTSS